MLKFLKFHFFNFLKFLGIEIELKLEVQKLPNKEPQAGQIWQHKILGNPFAVHRIKIDEIREGWIKYHCLNDDGKEYLTLASVFF